MAWRNTPDSFGLITRIIHWTMALAIIGMLALGTRLSDMQPGLANLWLYSLHKSIGLILFALVLIRIVWHRISPPPAPTGRARRLVAARRPRGAPVASTRCFSSSPCPAGSPVPPPAST